MARIRTVFVVLLFTSMGIVPAVRAGVPPTLLFECEHTASGGDNLSRGFYLPSFPGSRLDAVDLWIASDDADTFTVSLTARADTYDGPVVGTATATFSIDDEQIPVTFDFGGVPVQPGSIVTFAFQVQSGSGTLFFNVGTCSIGDTSCTACGGNVIETGGTSPPLSTFRRNSVGIRVYGALQAAEPIPVVSPAGAMLLLLLVMGAGMLAIKMRVAAGS